MRDIKTITEMAHKLPKDQTSGLFFFVMGYLGDDMPEAIREEIERRYMEKESV